MLENLQTAAKPEPQPFGRPAIEFNGDEGFATTPGLPEGADFKDFLIDAGYNPDEITVVGTPRTSRWQRYDGEWLTSYRFSFTLNQSAIDLPTLYAQVKKTKPKASQPQTKIKQLLFAGQILKQVRLTTEAVHRNLSNVFRKNSRP